MRVLPFYRPISRGRKFDQCGAGPDYSGARHYDILWQFEAENANFIHLIARANMIPIVQKVKYGSAKCK